VKMPVAMSIAGSDSGGGAGIQADLKTFAALGVYGTSAITAITAQNTVGVTDVLELPPELVVAQIDAVVSDIGVAAAKTGMLSSARIIEAVAGAVREHELSLLVVDPVMVAKGGARLLRDDAVDALRTILLPLAAAEVLLGRSIATLEERRDAAEELVRMGARAAVVKGGHAEGDAVDVYSDGEQIIELSSARIETPNTHGSGCTFSAAITSYLALGLSTADAVRRAKAFISSAIEFSIEVGKGHGPVNPMFEITR
jgi:hydroxymethylpyrimidine/phosphomethylpyrimidine kinase